MIDCVTYIHELPRLKQNPKTQAIEEAFQPYERILGDVEHQAPLCTADAVALYNKFKRRNERGISERKA